MRTVLVVATLISLGGSAEAAAPPLSEHMDPVILAAFDALALEITRVPDEILTRGQRIALLIEVRVAEALYRRHHPCMAMQILGAYLHQTQALRGGERQSVAEGLYNQGRRLRDDVVAGTPATSPCHDPRVLLREPDVHVRASDNKRLGAMVSFGAPRLLTRRIAGEIWTELEIPGLRAGVAHEGTPAIPVFRRLIGVPDGAQLELTSVRPRVAETIRMHLIPLQAVRYLARLPVDEGREPPPASAYFDGPFEKDDRAYATDAALPSPVCRVGHLGRVRDLSLAVLECAAGQYNPVTDTMTLFESVEFEVAFRGGTGYFVTAAALSPFELAFGMYQGTVLNRDAVARFVGRDIRRVGCLGEELLILTHPDFRAAADALAQWKRTKGIATNVFDVNDGSGSGPDTNEAIDAFIEERYDTCLMRPSYVLLFGDVDRVPTFLRPRLMRPDTNEMVATDHPYACRPGLCDVPLVEGSGLTPSFGLGRIPVPNASLAQAVVDKIIKYESAPPEDLAFYQNALVAADFECCREDLMYVPDPDGWEDVRSFVQNAEFVQNFLAAQGFMAQRIYTTGTDYHPDYEGEATPKYFSTGLGLPPPLRPEDQFPWDGNGQQVVDALHDGRFLVVHLDHGWVSGWVSPPFVISAAVGLENGELLPVVFSLNCSSGAFDYNFNSFAEPAFKKRLTDSSPSGAPWSAMAWRG